MEKGQRRAEKQKSASQIYFIFYLSSFCSRMWQKSSAAALMCKNIGNFMLSANSNCLLKYLFLEEKTRWRIIRHLQWNGKDLVSSYSFCGTPEHTFFESLPGKSESCHSPTRIHQLLQPYATNYTSMLK